MEGKHRRKERGRRDATIGEGFAWWIAERRERGEGREGSEQRKQKERIRGCWPGLRIRKAHAGSQWGRTRIATVPTQRRRGRRKRLQRSRRHRPNFTMPSLNVWMLDAKLSLGLHSVLCAFLYVYAPHLDDRRFALTASKCFEYLSFWKYARNIYRIDDYWDFTNDTIFFFLFMAWEIIKKKGNISFLFEKFHSRFWDKLSITIEWNRMLLN